MCNHTNASFILTVQVRVSGYGGWFLLRLSLHDPVLPLNIEVSNCIAIIVNNATSELNMFSPL